MVEDGGFVNGDDVCDAVAGVDYDAAAETYGFIGFVSFCWLVREENWGRHLERTGPALLV